MYIASAEGASENVRVLCWTTEYDILFSNVQGKAGASAPLSPPAAADEHGTCATLCAR